MTAKRRLAELGIELPPVAIPAGAYLPAVRTGNLVYTAGRHRDPALLVRQGRRVEKLSDALPPLHLDEQRPATVGRQGERQRGRHRRLAGAALAGHDVQPGFRPGTHAHHARVGRAARRGSPGPAGGTVRGMQKWEYATVPLLVHATKQILDNWGQDGWELVAVIPGPNPEQLVAYLKRPLS